MAQRKKPQKPSDFRQRFALSYFFSASVVGKAAAEPPHSTMVPVGR
jgi:hypothetical protein